MRRCRFWTILAASSVFYRKHEKLEMRNELDSNEWQPPYLVSSNYCTAFCGVVYVVCNFRIDLSLIFGRN